MPVVTCTSIGELLRELHRLQGLPGSGQWFFRGQAKASWGLTPSLFRRGLRDEQRFERDLLESLRRELERRTTLPERLIADDDYLLAIAQHYGSPTRLLDWTLSPLTAAYFAAWGSLTLGGNEPFAIFATAAISSLAQHAGESTVLYPRSGGNANVTAQLGLFVKHEWGCRDYWLPQYETTSQCPVKVTSHLDSRFLKFVLPRTFAGRLLDELRTRGTDGISIYPGLHGFVATAVADASQSLLDRQHAPPGTDEADD